MTYYIRLSEPLQLRAESFIKISVFSVLALFLFLTGFSEALKAQSKESYSVVVLPVEDKTRLLGEAQKEEIYDRTVKGLNKTRQFEVLNRSKTKTLIDEFKLDQSGLTREVQSELLKSSEGIIAIKTDLKMDGGTPKVVISMRFILRDGREFPASSEINMDNPGKGIDESVKSLVRSEIFVQRPPEQTPEYNNTLNIIQSLILPGWGQWSQDRKITGSVIFGTFIASGAALAVKDSQYKKYSADYDSENLYGFLFNTSSTLSLWNYMQVKEARSGIKSSGSTASSLSIMTAAVYLYNIVDVIWIGGRRTSLNDTVPGRGKFAFDAGKTRTGDPVFRNEENYSIRYTLFF